MKKNKRKIKQLTFNQAYLIALSLQSIGSERVIATNASIILKRFNSLLRLYAKVK